MNENLEAHLLAGIGLVRGIAEEVKGEVTIERVEVVGLVCGIAGFALATHEAIKSLRITHGTN